MAAVLAAGDRGVSVTLSRDDAYRGHKGPFERAISDTMADPVTGFLFSTLALQLWRSPSTQAR
ncbi:MAG: hypothetical protein R8G34_01120 [Paracoccaceae bacterium]|nr:hypothetical protein [Paracoccaceae bacterium]